MVDKKEKYDRQIRLWGDHGQQRLEQASVCVIGATATGTETLKNLILPGLGKFTIVDDKLVTSADLENNFFYDATKIGKSRASSACELLEELNPDSHGRPVESSVASLLQDAVRADSFFAAFTVVVVAERLDEVLLLQLADLLAKRAIPLVIARSSGMIGVLRLVYAEHCVIETHPDNVLEDMRLDRPIDGLTQLSEATDLNTLTRKEHAHVPWLILVDKAVRAFRHIHDGRFPTTRADKVELRKLLDTLRWSGSNTVTDDVDLDAEVARQNFEQAHTALNTALTLTHVPDSLQRIFADLRCSVSVPAQDASSMRWRPFWRMMRALKAFVDETGALPLRGSLPDMHADTRSFVALQEAYREQARRDAARVLSLLPAERHDLETEADIETDTPGNCASPTLPVPGITVALTDTTRSPNSGASDAKRLRTQRDAALADSSVQLPLEDVTPADIDMLCRNAPFVRVLTMHSLSESYRSAALRECLDDPLSDAVWLVVLLACDRFAEANAGRLPGAAYSDWRADIPRLAHVVSTICHELLADDVQRATALDASRIEEAVRTAGAELHSVAAFIGGCAAQEVIKLITVQYVPLCNTLVYNAIGQSTTSVTL